MSSFSLFSSHCINTLRPRQNGCHYVDNIFTCIFLKWKFCSFLKFHRSVFPQVSMIVFILWCQIIKALHPCVCVCVRESVGMRHSFATHFLWPYLSFYLDLVGSRFELFSASGRSFWKKRNLTEVYQFIQILLDRISNLSWGTPTDSYPEQPHNDSAIIQPSHSDVAVTKQQLQCDNLPTSSMSQSHTSTAGSLLQLRSFFSENLWPHGKQWRLSLILTHWGWDKMAATFQTTFLNTFSWMKMLKFQFKFNWNLFPRVQWTMIQHWFR